MALSRFKFVFLLPIPMTCDDDLTRAGLYRGSDRAVQQRNSFDFAVRLMRILRRKKFL
jgi:hypothetical protein